MKASQLIKQLQGAISDPKGGDSDVIFVQSGQNVLTGSPVGLVLIMWTFDGSRIILLPGEIPGDKPAPV